MKKLISKARLTEIKVVIKTSILILFTSLVMLSCKKTKLDGDYEKLIGTWQWTSGWSDNGSSDYKVDLAEKGKYKLYKGGKKVEYGRLLKDGDNLKFVSDNFIKRATHKYLFLDRRKIYLYGTDTISIIEQTCCDFPSSTFVKK